MATVVPAKAPSSIAKLFVDSYDSAQRRKLQQQQIDLLQHKQDAIDTGNEELFNQLLLDAKRNLDVTKTRNDPVAREQAQFDFDKLNNINPDNRNEFIQVKNDSDFMRQQIFAQRAQIDAQKTQVLMANQQMKMAQFVNKSVNDATDPFANTDYGQDAGANEVSQIKSLTKRAMLDPKNKDVQLQLFEAKKTFTANNKDWNIEQSKQLATERQAARAETGFSDDVLERLPMKSRTQVERAGLLGTPIDVRWVKPRIRDRFSSFKRGGGIPFGIDDFFNADIPMTKDDYIRNNNGTDAEWDNFMSVNPSEMPVTSVKDEIDKKVGEKGKAKPAKKKENVAGKTLEELVSEAENANR